jgi:tight adherence protein C
MSTAVIFSLAAGLLLGLATALVASAVVSKLGRGHPVLAEALAALDERTPLTAETSVSPLTSLVRHLPGRVPAEDLAVLGMGRDRFLLGRLVSAGSYAAAGPALTAVLTVLGTGLPIVIPGGITLIGAVAGWTSYTRRIEQRADAMREEMRATIVSYLQQVSLLRHGGAGVATALTLPARLLNDSWAMRRIRQELDLAEHAGEMPWDGLRRLADHTDVTELADLSSIAATAGQDGGAVIETLLARAESLHDELLADQHADAHRASGQMGTPGALLAALISGWILYPACVALLGN